MADAAQLSSEEDQDVERFAEVVFTALERVDVTRYVAADAFKCALMRDLPDGQIEVRVAAAHWRHAFRRGFGWQCGDQ